MNSILLIAYKVVGKNVATGLFSVIGVALWYVGIEEIISTKKTENFKYIFLDIKFKRKEDVR